MRRGIGAFRCNLKLLDQGWPMFIVSVYPHPIFILHCCILFLLVDSKVCGVNWVRIQEKGRRSFCPSQSLLNWIFILLSHLPAWRPGSCGREGGSGAHPLLVAWCGRGGGGAGDGQGGREGGWPPPWVLLLQSMFFSHWVEGGRTPFLNPGGLWCTFSCCCPGPNQTPMISLLFHGNGWLVIRGRQGCDTINWKTVKIFDVCQEF